MNARHSAPTNSMGVGGAHALTSGERDVLDALRATVAVQLQVSVVGTVDSTSDVDLLISNALDEYAREALHRGQPPLSETAEHRIRQALRNSFVGAGGLQPLLDDEAIETININGCDNVQVQYRDGRRARVAAVAHSDAELIEQLRDMGARLGAHERRFDPDAPELAMQLPGGARLHAMQVISDRVAVSIRRHPMVKVSLDDLVGMAELTPTMADLFTALVLARRNIVISGGPAAGKTTFLRALASAIPVQERLIVIEDSRELSLDPQVHPDMISMQARQANIEGVGEFSLDQCVRAALRLTPDRVILGEVRGAEVVQMAKAMSIGVDGSMATVHASSSSQALLRMTTYAMEPPASYPRSAATSLLGEAVHMVVHLDRTPNGLRVVSSVREIVGTDGDQIMSNEVYRPGPDRQAVPATRLRDETMDRLVDVGLDPAVLDRDGW
ncbi:CpaF family protein [Micromonospora ureilytica]|uniref:CpaF family protein n=1 Tax=Micromonospora ureilytica TaxID=709868 RepID=UPI00403A0FF1